MNENHTPEELVDFDPLNPDQTGFTQEKIDTFTEATITYAIMQWGGEFDIALSNPQRYQELLKEKEEAKKLAILRKRKEVKKRGEKLGIEGMTLRLHETLEELIHRKHGLSLVTHTPLSIPNLYAGRTQIGDPEQLALPGKVIEELINRDESLHILYDKGLAEFRATGPTLTFWISDLGLEYLRCTLVDGEKRELFYRRPE